MSFAIMLPAGDYWVGDPCYVFPNDTNQWQDLIEKADYFDKPKYVTLENIIVVAGSTAYGDGCYFGTNGFQYGVDAGLLGIIPMSTVNFLNPSKHSFELGTVEHFDSEFMVKICDGHFDFYKFIIETDDE